MSSCVKKKDFKLKAELPDASLYGESLEQRKQAA
jgi:hypothetical protein